MDASLQRQATMVWVLKAHSIVDTAKADIKRYALREGVAAKIKHAKKNGLPKPSETMPTLAFLPSHIRGAKTPSEVIGRALKNQYKGLQSHNATTVLLYRDKRTLEHAYEIALAQEAAEKNGSATDQRGEDQPDPVGKLFE